MNVSETMDQPPFLGLPDFSQANVLVVGDVMLDRYWNGPAVRISPEAPVPVVHIQMEETRIGGAGNVALNAAVLGANARLLGLAGQDVYADQLEQMLMAGGVKCVLQRVEGSRTITKLRILSRHQQLLRADFEDQFLNWNSADLQLAFERQLFDADVVILSDYSKGALRQSTDLIFTARKAGKPVIVDPKGTNYERYRGATVITPNLLEFEAVVGHCGNEAEIERKGEALRATLDLEAVLVTRSENGMTLLARGRAPLHLPTRAREVYDVTGAGDTVVATLSAALGAGVSLPESVALANMAAGVVVTKLGTATVSHIELQQALNYEAAFRAGGIFEEDDLFCQVSGARTRGERIVMTNGYFDILHPRHIDALENARALGDKLIVAVNDDASIKRLEGVQRPVNSLSTRMRMVSALSCVDWVIPFSEDTPERLISRLMPDVLVMGED